MQKEEERVKCFLLPIDNPQTYGSPLRKFPYTWTSYIMDVVNNMPRWYADAGHQIACTQYIPVHVLYENLLSDGTKKVSAVSKSFPSNNLGNILHVHIWLERHAGSKVYAHDQLIIFSFHFFSIYPSIYY